MKYEIKIRGVTKGVFQELSQYVSDVKSRSPLFGFPGICFSPDNKQSSRSKWGMITKTIIDPTFKNKHKFLMESMQKNKEEDEFNNFLYQSFTFGKKI
mmetsp:Transcript_2425/g.3148  ORF Transcript_2425/g.3148 Transcript_2425/m.3148 type:complete len:98 (+) Transcript_2425:289-582(+)